MKIVKNEYSKNAILNFMDGFKIAKIIINDRIFDTMLDAFEYVDSIKDGETINVDIEYNCWKWNVLN